MFTPAELKRRAIDFSREHADDYDEKSQAQTFWRDFFAIFGLSSQRIGAFEARAKTLRGTVGFIDFFWPGTLLVEHKSRGRDLDAALQQALDYCLTGGLKETELPRYIIVSDFQVFRIMDLEHLGSGDVQLEFVETRIDLARETPTYVELPLAALHENLHRFNFVLGYEQRTYKEEDPVNIKAAELMGALHDDLRRVGYEGHPLELFLVRLMFCFFADDTGIFQKDQFSDYIEARSREDGSDLGQIINEVFRILDAGPDQRPKNLPDDLAALPYVNGQLFAERIDPPYFDAGLRATLLHVCRFNWAVVSPAIFGSLFQSVMEPKERRSFGAHYTSEKNILKTIHGLFLDALQTEFEKIGSRKTDREKLYRVLLDKIAGIRLMDPACGCGNFLILAYRELRRLEILIHKALINLGGPQSLSLDVGWEGRGITVDHLYGIEIAEFPAQIARVALWIMDHLMNVELAATLGGYRPTIPLVTSPKIINDNALQIDWCDVVRTSDLTFILGNPPFVGKKEQTKEQKEDLLNVFNDRNGVGVLDFVTCWYFKAAQYIQGTTIRCAFVSTNSITQGEQVGVLWSLLVQYGIHVNFAHRTFQWSNEAKGMAAVQCVIIGFSLDGSSNKQLYIYDDVGGDPIKQIVTSINCYLVPGKNTFLISRRLPICKIPEISYGSFALDDGNYTLKEEERNEILRENPGLINLLPLFLGGEELIHNKKRYCVWLKDAEPSIIRSSKSLSERIQKVMIWRSKSGRAATNKLATTPQIFAEIRQPGGDYIAIPTLSSEKRRYIPIAYLKKDIIASNQLYVVNGAGLYDFGILTSMMHMSWIKHVGGKLESRYRYSSNIIYNNFPWPMSIDSEESGKLQKRVEVLSQAVLDTRAQFPDASLADLYDPMSMPPVLVKAHRDLDAAVDRCYRKEPFKSELERVEYLFALYEEYTEGLLNIAKIRGIKKSK